MYNNHDHGILNYLQWSVFIVAETQQRNFCVNFRQTWNEAFGVSRRGLLMKI